MAKQVPKSIVEQDSKKQWREITRTYELEVHHFPLLRQALEENDTAIQANRIKQEQGLTFIDRYNQVREHPAIAIERKAKNNYRLLMREIGLDIAEEPPRPPAKY